MRGASATFPIGRKLISSTLTQFFLENLDDRIWALLNDDRFIKWVLKPDEETNLYWERWMEKHPEGRPLLLKAREIACDLAYSEKPAQAEELANAIWTGVQEKISGMPIPMRGRRTERKRRLWPWMAAASVVLLVVSGFLLRRSGSQPVAIAPPAATIREAQTVATVLREDDLERSNRSLKSQQVYLVDGSKVILQPGASIRHAAFLQKDRRVVYLEGDAFFEVAKDAKRPFYVYTHDLVVHVLGTSFKVTNKKNGDITVLVHSGKVAVSKKTGAAQQALILEPNHLAFYNELTHGLVSSVVAQPSDNPPQAGEIPSAPVTSFNFEETPVNFIFAVLQDAYGIPLHYDAKTFSGCRITTSLADETFEEKLKIICTAIGATYKIGSNGVFLDGKPCK
jgi:ferric-dicitrate binding protein FerR (iron transport regulator)